ncbi:pentapeptide repeat-containing protein [Actinoplanes sp. NPDC049316]|uniref:pentapeptide repeat-containing protein n=1 Tax=Actinoplanes sp. NPDC049316 TaxID=3154727 RepID=UPI00341956B5
MSTKPYDGTWDPQAFVGKELIGIDFSHRSLVGARFAGSVLKDCDFSDSDLSNADFTGADLYRCDFSRSILYAAGFDNANLTRADFTGSHIYGWLLNASANVTYTKLLSFSIESRRRSVAVDTVRPAHVREIEFGGQIDRAAELCASNYQVGKYRYTFVDLEPQEAALQRSQIYNRLKRLYRENHNGEAALHCLFYERYYLTRSYYRNSPLTGGKFRENLFKTLGKTAGGYLVEFVSGYGVRPLRILRNLGALWLIFFLATLAITSSAPDSGVLYSAPARPASTAPPAQGQPSQPAQLDLGKPDQDIAAVLHYSLLSTVTPDPQRYTSYGWMSFLSLAYFAMAATLLALLFSSVFLRLLSE